MKNTINDEKVADKIDASDKETIMSKVNEVTSWLENNQEASKEEYEDRQKELEGICTPIISKMYSAGGGGDAGGMPDMGGMGGMPGMGGMGGGGGSSGPKVEEVD
eukprot:NODE_4797_length_626_cov_951.535529_g4130_i0.p1 GENE.NODE_4797_length_626_cov_951.535529_g4130_i0~~NODE_4797_length_626_cov_951.535529_g4130_i0.p1  ORF type:complete len:114 (+),score=59.50 NODE_4797_length_626_cov_951.535529_g4130_i0:30-344(+)